MAGFSLLVFGLPRYAMRIAVAALIAIQGATGDTFMDTFMKVSSALVGLETLLEGMKNSKIERIISEGNALRDKRQPSA